MSRKLVCIADTHVHPWRLQSRDGGHDRLMDGLSVVRQSLALAKKLDAVWVFAGDMKQPKTYWPQQALTGLHALFREFKDVEMVMIAGNHDAQGEGGSGLAPFRDVARIVEDVQIIPTGAANLVCCPWNGDPATAAKLLTGANRKDYGERILVAHGFLQGCMLGPEDIRIAKGIPISAYGEFDLAVFGDVHKAQWRRPEQPEAGRPATWYPYSSEMDQRDGLGLTGSVLYCGSPYQQNWGERNDPMKGALVVDLDAKTIAMHYLTAPRYVHLELDYESAQKFIAQLDPTDEGDFVRIVYAGAFCTVTDQLREWGASHCRSFQLIPAAIERSESTRSTVHAAMSKRELLIEYMKTRPPKFDVAVGLDAGLRLAGVGDD